MFVRYILRVETNFLIIRKYFLNLLSITRKNYFHFHFRDQEFFYIVRHLHPQIIILIRTISKLQVKWKRINHNWINNSNLPMIYNLISRRGNILDLPKILESIHTKERSIEINLSIRRNPREYNYNGSTR